MRIVAIGEILWDVYEDGERLGGAPFNFAAHAVRLGHEVELVSAVADDERGRRARAKAARLGVGVEFLRTVEAPPTGVVSVRLTAGEPEYTIHRPAAYDAVRLAGDDLAALAAWRPDWLYYGTLFAHEPTSRHTLDVLIEALPKARKFYDVNLRRDSWRPGDVLGLLEQADAVKLNEHEAREIAALLGRPAGKLEDFARALGAGRAGRVVCITRGAAGCSLLAGERWLEAPGWPVVLADAVGAGDSFSAALVHGLGAGWPIARAADFANRVGALVASRPGAIPEWTEEQAWALSGSGRGVVAGSVLDSPVVNGGEPTG